MIYSNILKAKLRNFLKVFVLLLVSIFTLSLYSCQTSYVETYTPEQLRADDKNDGAKIMEVITKTDSTINLENYEAKYNRSEDVIICKKTDTTFINNGTTKQIKEKMVSKINLQNLTNAKTQKVKTDVPMTILAVTGITLVLLVIAIAVDTEQGGWIFGQ
jgi:hypothetical protein